MQPGEIGKHRRLFHARSIINVVGLLGSSPRVAVLKEYLFQMSGLGNNT